MKPDSLFLRNVQAKGLQVVGQSLIHHEPISFSSCPSTDWIFFSSPNAVRFFFDQIKGRPRAKLAAINKGTAQKLQALGFKAEFIGEGRDTTGIGNQFGEVAANGTVLFPQSSISLRSIQQQLSEKVECIDLIVYSTNSKEEFNLKGFSSLVFTSPSNVQAALESGGWDKNASLIAIGHTTEKALLEAGYADVKVAWTPSELALADLIAS